MQSQDPSTMQDDDEEESGTLRARQVRLEMDKCKTNIKKIEYLADRVGNLEAELHRLKKPEAQRTVMEVVSDTISKWDHETQGDMTFRKIYDMVNPTHPVTKRDMRVIVSSLAEKL